MPKSNSNRSTRMSQKTSCLNFYKKNHLKDFRTLERLWNIHFLRASIGTWCFHAKWWHLTFQFSKTLQTHAILTLSKLLSQCTHQARKPKGETRFMKKWRAVMNLIRSIFHPRRPLHSLAQMTLWRQTNETLKNASETIQFLYSKHRRLKLIKLSFNYNFIALVIYQLSINAGRKQEVLNNRHNFYLA